MVFSDDKGASWKQAEHVPTRSTLTAVTAHAGRLWAVGHDTVILTSGDRGLTWTLQYFDPERQQAAMDVQFFSPTDGIVHWRLWSVCWRPATVARAGKTAR